MSDKSHKKDLRRQRRGEEKARRTRDARRQSIMVWGGLGLIILVTGFIVIQAINPANQPGEFVRDQGNQHVSSPDEVLPGTYNSVPPTSGPHLGGLWRWGISQEQISDPAQIHNLEDGGVILQYDCPDGCPELEAQLHEFANQVLADAGLKNPATGETHFILAPYSGIRAASGGKPIALTAWTRLQYFGAVDAEAMLNFIRTYINIDHHVGGTG